MTVTTRRTVTPGVRLTNRVVTMLLRLGVPLGAVCLLTVPGRRSHMPRTTPVATFTFEGERYLMQGYRGADWVANARAAGQGLLGRGLRVRRVLLIEVPLAERRVILGHVARTARGSTARLVESGLVESADPESFAANAPTIAVFRVEDLT
jgi:F420H(2)-dependent quinone reductase